MMTKKSRCFLKGLSLLSVFCTTAFSASAQINVSATGGTTAASYSTLGAAFTAINNGTHMGLITINVVGNTTETASAVLNASGSGSASYTSIFIQPSGSTARSITGNVAGNLISLSGADFVSFDGLNTGGNSLTISNTNTGSTSSTIYFVDDASYNMVTNCTVRGSSTGTATGTIVFSAATSTGNDDNTLSNSTIADAGGNLPANAIYSAGTATTGMENSGIIISGNSIANYFSATLGSAGIQAAMGATAWTIQNNKFYQTTTLVPTTNNIIHSAIAVKTGSGYTITGNIIGYSSSAGTGTYTLNSTYLTQFYPIHLTVGTASPTSVQGNIITAINFNTSNNSSTGGGMFSGIYVTSGDVNIGTTSGNTIGAASGTGAITVTTAGSNGATMGIASSTTGTLVIQNNTIGSMSSLGTTATINTGLHGIFTGGVAASLTISNNTIGNATANNMVAGTLGVTTANSLVSGMNLNSATPPTTTVSGNTVQGLAAYGTGVGGYARGIWTAANTVSSSTYKVKNNTVKNITGYSGLTSVTNGQTAVLGINIAIGTADTISGNTVFNIEAANTGTGSYNASGITLANATNTVVCNNIVYGISNAGTGTTATAPPTIAGITIRSGVTAVTLYNNMISLGNGITTNTAIIGIWGNYGSTPSPVTNIYHNTVNIEGTASSGSLSSFCFHRGDFSINRLVTVDVRNNIFTNSRSGGAGTHYAIGNNLGFTASATGWGGNASDYNVLNANAATVGYWSADKTFADWQTASASDGNSYSGITVTYVNSANNLHLNMGTTATDIESGGATIVTVPADIDGQVRPGPAGSVNGGAFAPDLGADEIDGKPTTISWSGATNNNWGTNTNWVGNVAPGTNASARIPAGLTNYPIISTGTVAIRNIFINSGGSLTLTGGTLQVSRAITNNGTFDGMAGGTVEFNGTAPQTIPWNTFYANTLANLKINNSAGVTLGTTFYITGTLTPTSGVFNTNNALWLQSSALGTARIATGSASGGYINGDVTVQRLIPGKRAFRFLAHPFSSAIALTELTDDIDITGSGGSTNGFTNTSTNSPSSFWYDVSAGDNSTGGTNPGWTAFTSTNGAGANAWNPYTGARILVRGGLGEGLSGGAYTPSSVGIDMTGPVNQGDITVTLTKGSNTNYVFVGNPFPSQVNMDAVSGTNTGSAFYIWDATQGTKGGYTSYSFGSSSFNLPSCAGFFTTISANGSMLFEEADKTGSTPGTMFKTTGVANTVQLRMEDSTMFWDRLLLRFDGNAMATVDYPDAAKLYNPEISFYTFSKDDSMLSIDARPYTNGETIKLGLYSTLQKNFKIVASEFDMPAGTKLFLHDKFLNKTEEITGAGYEYWFTVTADPASTGNSRFELNTQGQQTNSVSVINEKHALMTLIPNPAKDNVIVHYEGMSNGSIVVTVKDIKGATVVQKQQASANNGNIQLSLNGLAAGVYMVTLQNGNQAIVQKLVKE